MNFVDPLGLFRFGKRPLGGFSQIHGGSLDNTLNTEIAHEHGFFEDGSGDNIGFRPEGLFSEEDLTGKGYIFEDEHYDDDIMREAVKNIVPGFYAFLGNNCQDYADRLRKEYERLKKERDNPCK